MSLAMPVAKTAAPLQAKAASGTQVFGLQRKCACAVTGEACSRCTPNRLQSPAMSGPQGEGVPPIVHDVMRSPGQPLDAATRIDLEGRFGHDFSGVRVHTDSDAAKSAEAVSAKAYTVGRTVVFGQGHYAPETGEGKRVLAHELTHVVQQSRGGAIPPLDPNSSLEQEADSAAANAVLSHTPIRVGRSCGAGLARLSWNDVRKKVRPVASLLGGELGGKAVDGAVARAEEITGPDVPKPAEPLIDRGIEAIGRLAPEPRPSPTRGSSNESTPTGEEGVRLATEELTGTPQPAPLVPPRVDPKEDTPELKEFFEDRWRKAQVFHGIKLAFAAKRTLTRAATRETVVKKSTRYWIVSHADVKTGEVFYYAAHNREAQRDEYAIGPAQLDSFYANENYFANIAEHQYPSGGGELKDWEEKSGQVTDAALDFDWEGVVDSLIGSNSAAFHDPDWVVSNVAAVGPSLVKPGALPKGPSRLLRRLRNTSAGVLTRTIVATENSLPVHTGGGGAIVNAPSIVAGEIRAPLAESGLPNSKVAKASANVSRAVGTVPDIAAEGSKPAVAGNVSIASQSPAAAQAADIPTPAVTGKPSTVATTPAPAPSTAQPPSTSLPTGAVGSNISSQIAGASPLLSRGEYEARIGSVIPGQYDNPIFNVVERAGQSAADVLTDATNPTGARFIQTCQAGNWALAGTLFHSEAARQLRQLAAPLSIQVRAEDTVQSGSGGSRLDVSAIDKEGLHYSIDWKTTGRSGLSTGSREEMRRHARQYLANRGTPLDVQISKSWVDFVRSRIQGVTWPK
jgi:hypothetical protein